MPARPGPPSDLRTPFPRGSLAAVLTKALLYGIGSALPLVVGSAVGLRWKLPDRVLAALMAFGAGTLVAAAAEELFGPAFERAGALPAGAALMAGAAVYVVADHLLDNRLGPSALGWALLLGVVLDGVPENLALGVNLGGASAAGVVLLVAIAIGNLPEAVSGAARMRDLHGLSHRRVLGLWTLTAAVLVVVTVAGSALSDVVPTLTIDLVGAFAGGAVLAVLADSLLPEAYSEGGWWVGLATALGFLVAFTLGG
jgi:ZIP family zinc transporter